MKRCGNCNIFKELTEFNKRNECKNGYKSMCRSCQKEQHKQYRITHNEKILIKQKKWNKENRDYFNNYKKTRKKTDVQYRLSENLRKRLKKVLKTTRKSISALKLLGCSVSDFKKKMESLWSEGMTWNNYGEWHIDHIKPCNTFNLVDEDEQKKCFHYTNLRPLWLKR